MLNFKKLLNGDTSFICCDTFLYKAVDGTPKKD